MKVFGLATIVLLCAGAIGCGNASPAQVFVYEDLRCGVAADGGSGCQEVGDGLPHQICHSDAECPSDAPFCRTLGLYKGGDFNCNGSVRICRTANHDDCT